MFVAFEGPEGSGKSTQVQLLAAALSEAGYDVVRTREPGGTPIGERVRALVLDPICEEMLPSTEALLYAAARAQLVGEVIAPALRGGAIVISDRYVDSTLAYQIGGRGLPESNVRALQAIATAGILPDLRVLLDVPVAVGLARRYREGTEVNRLDEADVAFHDRVATYYRGLAAADPAGWLRLDALRPPDALAAEIRAAVLARVGIAPPLALISEEQ